MEIVGTRVEIIHAGGRIAITRTQCLRLEPRHLFSYDSSRVRDTCVIYNDQINMQCMHIVT